VPGLDALQVDRGAMTGAAALEDAGTFIASWRNPTDDADNVGSG